MSPDLRTYPGTVTIPQYRVNKTKQHTHSHPQICESLNRHRGREAGHEKGNERGRQREREQTWRERQISACEAGGEHPTTVVSPSQTWKMKTVERLHLRTVTSV